MSGCPSFIQWVLRYSEFGESKNREERDNCIRESLLGKLVNDKIVIIINFQGRSYRIYSCTSRTRV